VNGDIVKGIGACVIGSKTPSGGWRTAPGAKEAVSGKSAPASLERQGAWGKVTTLIDVAS